ncbi:7694_t:CDS:2, partial [Acaulospora morrowiae]
MDRTHIVALAKNILSFTSTLATHINIPDVTPCLLCGKEVYSLASNPQYQEFTLASCGHIFHQKCLEKYLEKGSQDKPSTTDENTTSMPVDSENATPVDEDSNVTVMKELGLLGGEEQSSSKTTDKASSSIQIIKETSDQATSPIEVVSITPGNSENRDDSISKDTSGQIQRPICEKCSEEISLEFTKPTIFLPCKHVVHYDCIKDSRKMCPTCPSSETMSEISTLVESDPSDAQKKRTRESSASTEKSSNKKAKKTNGKKKVSSTLFPLLERTWKKQ